MLHLLGREHQRLLASVINEAVADVIRDSASLPAEPELTAALGLSLHRRYIDTPALKVKFRYRGHHPQVEEPSSGADGGFLVHVENEVMALKKASLFQAKNLLGALDPVRSLAMANREAERLRTQAQKMLSKTDEAIVLFYTDHGFYAVDAWRYRNADLDLIRNPLGRRSRLITLGTYLGSWMARCTRGDARHEFIRRVEHREGFRHGIEMDVVTSRASVRWD